MIEWLQQPVLEKGESQKMAAKLLDGNALAHTILCDLKKEIEHRNLVLTLGIILVGNNPASLLYIKRKSDAARYIGVSTRVVKLPDSASKEDITQAIDRFNADPSITGFIIQLPLPEHLKGVKIGDHIDPKKDVDGLTPGSPYTPATAKAIDVIIHTEHLEIAGKHAVVVGRSSLVGLPVAKILLDHDATVTITHSKTKNLAYFTTQADILVAATGKGNSIVPSMVKPGAIVFNIGITKENDGQLVGDVDPKAVAIASFYTPVPGGIGPVTVASLLCNVVVPPTP